MAKESIRIVIINDDPNDVSLLRRCLINESGQNYTFLVAKTGEEGIHACLAPGSQGPGCVLVDLHLPDMSGLDLLKRLKDDVGAVQFPVVLFIDSGEECKAATAALRAGAHDYIAKSWLTADGLACAVENAIERFKLQERLKKKRAALERQDREFRALVENVPDIITRFDTECRHVYINPAIERATGLPPESFLGKTSREAGMPERLCDFWESVLKEAMAGGSELTFEFDFTTPAGPRCFQARLVPQFSETGEVDSVLAVSTDVTEGKQAEEALRASEEHLRNVIDRLIDFVGVMTPSGILVEANRHALEIASLEPKDVLRKPLEDTYWWSYSPEVQADLRRAIECAARGEEVRHDALIRTGEDRFMTFDFMIAPLIDDNGKVTDLILSGIDITERKRAEEVRARLAAIVESSEDAIISKTLEGVIRSWNAGAERLFGYSHQEAVGQPITLIIPPERRDEERVILERLCRGERVEHFETVRVSKDGRRLDISLTISPICDDVGRVIGASKIARDIGEKKRNENALRESEERYRRAATAAARAAEANAKFRAFFEQGRYFAGVLTLDGTLIEANRLCLDACGFTCDEVIGKPFWECGWWNRSAALMEMVRAASLQAAGGRLFRTETNYFVADGAERMVDLILAPVTDEAGRVLFVAATGTDVTNRRRMEDALRQQAQRKDEFLAMLAHELRNPLAAIRTAVHILLLKGQAQPELTWGRQVIERQAKHLTRLIEDLLDVSRISTGKIQLKPVPLDVRDVVSRAAESVLPLMTAKQHHLKIILPPQPLSALADPARLEQVVGNILTNAAKYTDNGGSITLNVAQEGSSIVLRLRDNGIGIDSEMLPHIFDLYTQVDGTLARSLGGLGIGLTLVKRLVELHGGRVTAASEGPGKGSEFTIRLPATDSPPGPPHEASREETPLVEPSPTTPRQRVLVVDDNVDIAKGLAMLIETAGYEVKTAHEGPSALAIACDVPTRVRAHGHRFARHEWLQACAGLSGGRRAASSDADRDLRLRAEARSRAGPRRGFRSLHAQTRRSGTLAPHSRGGGRRWRIRRETRRELRTGSVRKLLNYLHGRGLSHGNRDVWHDEIGPPTWREAGLKVALPGRP